MTNKSEQQDTDYQVRIGFTHGDVNGIGYEIIIKTLMDKRIMDLITPVVFGHSKVASYHRKTINAKDFNFNLIKRVDAANPKRPNIYNIDDREVKIELGMPTKVAGEMAYLSLKSAVESIEHDEIDAIVTAPINKKSIQSENFKTPGHTEFLAERHHVTDFLMMMVSKNFRIGVITGHIPLRDVPDAVNQDLIINKIQIMHESLRRDFAIAKPKIAVLGLNPHAGDDGLLGKEEIDTIIPAIQKVFDDGILAYGPYPADGFFAAGQHQKFDGVLAMYHDQGLIPFKALAFDDGVNYTAGLPIVRTSPAHGTAYDIAGKNQADESSMRAAVYLACDIFRNRRDFDEMNANPLFTDDEDEEENNGSN
jgi:4-hydroxythreonine-4-phosphate dehydrogenase